MRDPYLEVLRACPVNVFLSRGIKPVFKDKFSRFDRGGMCRSNCLKL